MPSLGKTNTPEFGSPCYTEPDVAPPAVTPVGSPPHGWRVVRWRRGSRRGRAGARGTGLGRRWLHPDPGLVLRTGRAQADPRPDQCRPDVRRSGRPGARPAPSPARCATPPPCSTCWPAGGSVIPPGRHLLSAPFLGACDRDPGRLRVARFITPVITDSRRRPVRAWRPGTTPRGCWSRARPRRRGRRGPAARARRSRPSRPAGPCSPRCRRPRPAASTELRPLTRWLAERGRRGQRSGVRPRDRRLRQYAADALVALAPYDLVLTPTLADPAAVRRRAARRRRPRRRLRGAEAPSRRGPAPGTSPGCRRSRCRCTGPDDGLPVGVMLAARPAEEELLLAVAAQLEAAAPWHERRPAAGDGRRETAGGCCMSGMSELTPYLCVADARAAPSTGTSTCSAPR